VYDRSYDVPAAALPPLDSYPLDRDDEPSPLWLQPP
jgi:hypothetical protein